MQDEAAAEVRDSFSLQDLVARQDTKNCFPGGGASAGGFTAANGFDLATSLVGVVQEGNLRAFDAGGKAYEMMINKLQEDIVEYKTKIIALESRNAELELQLQQMSQVPVPVPPQVANPAAIYVDDETWMTEMMASME